jgi:hypothetical protein
MIQNLWIAFRKVQNARDIRVIGRFLEELELMIYSLALRRI